jgi:hypothetical protein
MNQYVPMTANGQNGDRGASRIEENILQVLF